MKEDVFSIMENEKKKNSGMRSKIKIVRDIFISCGLFTMLYVLVQLNFFIIIYLIVQNGLSQFLKMVVSCNNSVKQWYFYPLKAHIVSGFY